MYQYVSYLYMERLVLVLNQILKQSKHTTCQNSRSMLKVNVYQDSSIYLLNLDLMWGASFVGLLQCSSFVDFGTILIQVLQPWQVTFHQTTKLTFMLVGFFPNNFLVFIHMQITHHALLVLFFCTYIVVYSSLHLEMPSLSLQRGLKINVY